jgi:class 3 adenylate cyclase
MSESTLIAEPPGTASAQGDAVPFWRRPRRLRRQITGTLVATALVSVVLFGTLNYVAADRLLLDGTEDQLADLAQARARSIEHAATRAIGRIAISASDRAIVRALDDFDAAFDDLADVSLSAEQADTLEQFYVERVVEPINSLDVVEIELADVLPSTDAGRWVQYHYALPDRPGAVASTSYDDAVAVHQEYLASLAETFESSDLLLVDGDGRIVYSTARGIDLGTSLSGGPYADGTLAELVLDRLDRVRAGEALLTSMSIYVPARAEPVLFGAASIRDGTEVIGTLAVRLDVAALDAIVSAGVDVEDAGLGDGDTYIVSATGLLQSTPRAWERDRAGYLDDIDDAEGIRIVEALGSPTGVQRILTDPVVTAIEGDDFVGRTTNALDRPVYSAATSIDVAGVEWVVVTETPLDDARKPLFDYLRRMAVVVAVIVTIATIVGFLLARRLTRPIPVAVQAARAVAEGERTLDLPDLRNDEFGDLGRRLIRTADTLSRQERALEAEFERKRQLLLSVLPPHLVRDDGAVSGSGDRVDTATVIAVAIDTLVTDLDPVDLAEALAATVDIAEGLAVTHDVDRIRVAADRSLFVSGAGTPDDGVDVGLAFAAALADGLHEFSERTSLEFTTHIGLSTGPIATGVLAQGNLTFAAWGEPVRRALAISALADTDEILVDAGTADAAGDAWTLVAADDVIDLDGQSMAVLRLVLPDHVDDLAAQRDRPVAEPAG